MWRPAVHTLSPGTLLCSGIWPRKDQGLLGFQVSPLTPPIHSDALGAAQRDRICHLPKGGETAGQSIPAPGPCAPLRLLSPRLWKLMLSWGVDGHWLGPPSREPIFLLSC